MQILLNVCFGLIVVSATSGNCTDDPNRKIGIWRERCWERTTQHDGNPPTFCNQYTWNYESQANFTEDHPFKCGNTYNKINLQSIYDGDLSNRNCSFYHHQLYVDSTLKLQIDACYERTIMAPSSCQVSSYKGINDDDDNNPNDYSEVASITLGIGSILSPSNPLLLLLIIKLLIF